jgi:hypothetical protein
MLSATKEGATYNPQATYYVMHSRKLIQKVKLSLCRHYTMEAQRASEVNLAQDRVNGELHAPIALRPGQRPAPTRWIDPPRNLAQLNNRDYAGEADF